MDSYLCNSISTKIRKARIRVFADYTGKYRMPCMMVQLNRTGIYELGTRRYEYGRVPIGSISQLSLKIHICYVCNDTRHVCGLVLLSETTK